MRLPPHIVAIQLVSFIPVGTAMIIVADHEIGAGLHVQATVNRWCAQPPDREQRVADQTPLT